MALDRDARLTRAQAAKLAGVKPRTVYMWRRRGKLDVDHKGRYRLGDILDVELETRYSPNNRVPRVGKRHIQAA